MARVTADDCLNIVPNRFQLTLLAVHRARQLMQGAEPLVDTHDKSTVTALREIADGKISLECSPNTIHIA